MLIVIIAWLYVVLLMSLTEHSVAAGIMTFLLYGLLPLSVALYLLDTPARRARKRRHDSQPARDGEAAQAHIQTQPGSGEAGSARQEADSAGQEAAAAAQPLPEAPASAPEPAAPRKGSG